MEESARNYGKLKERPTTMTHVNQTDLGNERQVDELNQRVLTRIAPSKIHGVGLFALRDLPKGLKLHADALPRVYDLPYSHFSKLFPEVKSLLIERWPSVSVKHGAKFAFPDTRIQAYMNHSDDPNYSNITDTMLKDVKAGEEITENYRNINGWDTVFPWLTEKA